MHKGHRTLIKFLFLELHTLDLLRIFALYTRHSRVCVSPTCKFSRPDNDLKLAVFIVVV